MYRKPHIRRRPLRIPSPELPSGGAGSLEAPVGAGGEPGPFDRGGEAPGRLPYHSEAAEWWMVDGGCHTPNVCSSPMTPAASAKKSLPAYREPTRAATGIWIHQICQALAGEATTPVGVLAYAKVFFAEATVPPGRGRGWKNSCALAASLYLNHLRPPAPWSFAGSEVPLAHARADLLWQTPPPVRHLLDELTITTDPRDPELLDQVERLVAGGVERFGSSFAGVRVLLLETPQRSWLALPGGGTAPLLGAGKWIQ